MAGRLTRRWLDRVRLASVRIQGCSASFVSGEGLILTNHHCVASCLFDNSKAGADYLNDGYVADRRDMELKCPGQQAEVVTSIGDVTGAIKAAIATEPASAAPKPVLSPLTVILPPTPSAGVFERAPAILPPPRAARPIYRPKERTCGSIRPHSLQQISDRRGPFNARQPCVQPPLASASAIVSTSRLSCGVQPFAISASTDASGVAGTSPIGLKRMVTGALSPPPDRR